MEQHLLKINLPKGQRLYPAEFREALAATNKLPAEFFGYDASTGKPVHQAPKIESPDQLSDEQLRLTRQSLPENLVVPKVRIIGGTTWVGILCDDESLPLLHAAIVPASNILSARFRQPVPFVIEQHQVGLEELQHSRQYFVREMVIRKGARKDMPEDELKELVKKRIQTAIADQARAMNIDCPSDERMGVFVTEVLRPRGLQVVATQGKKGCYACLVDVRVFLNLSLLGYWFAGNLTSRGYGRIGVKIPDFLRRSNPQEAAE